MFISFRHEIREDCGTAKPLKRVLTSQLTAAAASASSAASSDDETAVEATEGGAVDRTTLTANLTATLFPVLIEIYSASAGPGVKHAALQVRDYKDVLTDIYYSYFLNFSRCMKKKNNKLLF